MARYVHYDISTGEFKGFYSDKTDSTIPSPSIELTDEEYNDYLENFNTRKIDINTQSIITIVPASDIAGDRMRAKNSVDNSAEAARSRYLTWGAGQAMTYQEKSDEATDYVASGYPADLSSFPFIQAEVNATGKTATQTADDILTQRSAWIAVGAQIEEARLGGKANIDAANSETAIDTARDNVVAILDAI